MSWLVTFSLNAGRIVFMEILLMMCLGKSYFLFFFFFKAEIVPIIGGCLVCQSCSYFFKNTWKRQRKMLPLPSFTAKHSRQVAEGTSERLGGGARFRDCWLQTEYRRGLRFTFMSLLHRDFYFMCAVFFFFFFLEHKSTVWCLGREVSRPRQRRRGGGDEIGWSADNRFRAEKPVHTDEITHLPLPQPAEWRCFTKSTHGLPRNIIPAK